MNLVVLGAGAPVGRLVTQLALRAGHTVTAVTPDPAAFPVYDHRVRIAEADVLDAGAVDWVVRGHDAVVPLPGPAAPHPVRAQAARNVVRAMLDHAVRRLVYVSPAAPGWSRAARRDARCADGIVSAAGLDWTLLRPGRLTPRADLAHAVVREISRGDHVGRSVRISGTL